MRMQAICKFVIDPIKKLERLKGRQMQNAQRKAIRKASRFLQLDVKPRIKERTGALRKAIGVKISSKKGKPVYGVVGAKTDAPARPGGIQPKYYSWQYERGTKWAKGSDALKKSIEANGVKVMEIMSEVIDQEIARLLG